MKKFLTKLLCVIIATIGIVSLTGCTAAIPKDYKDVRKNLRKNNYEVTVESLSADGLDYLEGLLEFLTDFVEDVNYKKGLELLYSFDEDYYDIMKVLDVVVCGIRIDASKNNTDIIEQLAIVVYFNDEKGAKEHYPIFKDFFDFITDCKLSNKDEDLIIGFNMNDVKYGRDGNKIYFCTKQAIKDMKK